MDEAVNSRLFLVSELGPTQFLIKDEAISSIKFKVTIGDEQTCSGCMGGNAARRAASNATSSANQTASSSKGGVASQGPELCKHVYFVMLKVLRLPRSNPLVWQRSLLDAEIGQALDARFKRQRERERERDRQRRREAREQRGQAAGTAGDDPTPSAKGAGAAFSFGAQEVPSRPIEDDDVCPICQDDLIPASMPSAASSSSSSKSLPLVHCRFSCGAQLHAQCMRVWTEHQLSTNHGASQPVLCPMCRGKWAGEARTATEAMDERERNERVLRELKIKELEQPAASAASASTDISASGATSSSSSAKNASVSSSSNFNTAQSNSATTLSRAYVRCNECRKKMRLSEGRFMRCVHCGPHSGGGIGSRDGSHDHANQQGSDADLTLSIFNHHGPNDTLATPNSDNVPSSSSTSTGYNLCRTCFVRQKGLTSNSSTLARSTAPSKHVHTFIEAKPLEAADTNASRNRAGRTRTDEEKSSTSSSAVSFSFPYAFGIDWIPAPTKAPSLSAQLASVLQSRDLTPADYDLLLGLDEMPHGRYGNRQVMHTYLTRSLPQPVVVVSASQRLSCITSLLCSA